MCVCYCFVSSRYLWWEINILTNTVTHARFRKDKWIYKAYVGFKVVNGWYAANILFISLGQSISEVYIVVFFPPFFSVTHSHVNFHCSDAYKVACLGVTDGDWECLAHAALEDLNFPVARQAFIRIKDLKYLELINEFQVWKLLFHCICVYLPVQVCHFYNKSCNITHWMIWKDLVNQTLTERPITFHCSIKQWHLAPILRV